jgi:fructosamine-3-kinase
VRLAGVDLSDARPVSGGDICHALVATTSEGRRVFAKTCHDPPHGFFAADARGLDFLRVPGGPPLPAVVAVGDDGLVLEHVEPGRPSRSAAESFGRALASMHASTVPGFGAPDDGFIGTLPLDNSSAGDWPTFYVERRVLPYLSALGPDDRAAVGELCRRIHDVAGPEEPPARAHGDLWAGNLLWSDRDVVWLVDAGAAHGGHREADLAMLQLFGAPHLDLILGAYGEVAPLADGWRARVPLHQLHPLLVHATMFGGGYAARAAAMARAALGG